MWARQSSNIQQQLDSEWLIEFAHYLDKNSNKKELEKVKKIFIETYLENIQEGLHPKEALQKAKMIALCFLMLQK